LFGLGISIIGLGKLGAPFAACLAAKGFKVIAVDVDEKKIAAINQGHSPVFEPGLEDLLRSGRGTMRATVDYRDAVLDSEVTFVVLPTPSESNGGFSLHHVLPACEQIATYLRQKSDFHIVVVTSTVLPGSTGGVIRRVLEENSGKVCGEGFGLCYNPEFVALGTVIRDLLKPDFILIGESDERTGDKVASIYSKLCENDPPIARMNLVNAEITKLSVNTFVTTKIAFANMVARICERLPGADVDTVTSALARDSRIGGRYLKGAIGYGGPCFPRDNLALAFLAREVGLSAILAEATEKANRKEIRGLIELIKSKLSRPAGRVGILGLAYKPSTDVVDESQGLLLAQALLAEGIPVSAYDPIAMPNARKFLGESVILARSATECIQAAEVVVLATPWDDFRGLAAQAFMSNGERKVLVDCWRLLDPKDLDPFVEYLPLGVGAKSHPGEIER
jgi:UDPglucose 6-dehydrogenase